MLDIKFNETAFDQRIYDAVERGVSVAKSQGYDVGGVSFFVKKPSKRLPEGAGAKILEESRNIGLAVDDVNPNYGYLQQLVVHEINHLEREKHSKIETLQDVLVSEGLAQMAERIAGYRLMPISLFQSEADREETINAMTPDFEKAILGNSKEADYDEYFGSKGRVRDYAGYAFGLEMVMAYMVETSATLSEATKTPTAHFVNHWQNKKTGVGL
jgi:uncharacterized protein YjaZ